MSEGRKLIDLGDEQAHESERGYRSLGQRPEVRKALGAENPPRPGCLLGTCAIGRCLGAGRCAVSLPEKLRALEEQGEWLRSAAGSLERAAQVLIKEADGAAAQIEALQEKIRALEADRRGASAFVELIRAAAPAGHLLNPAEALEWLRRKLAPAPGPRVGGAP